MLCGSYKYCLELEYTLLINLRDCDYHLVVRTMMLVQLSAIMSKRARIKNYT